jgi:hypothetical protein
VPEGSLVRPLGSFDAPPLDPGQSATGSLTLQDDRQCAPDELRRQPGPVMVRAALTPKDGPPGPDTAENTTQLRAPPEPKHDTNQTKQPATQPARDLTEVDGTSSGKARQVQVGMVQLVDGARAAAAGCRSLASPRGRFTRMPLENGRCTKVRWLRAQGTRRWRFKLRKTLPRGRYVIYSRALDKSGVPEQSFTARDRNRQVIRLR